MNCYYYAVYQKSTKEVTYANFEWAENFQDIVKYEAGPLFGCIEIAHETFKKIRNKEITSIVQICEVEIMVGNIEKLWSAACSGNIDYLKKYYENGGEKKLRYQAFGKTHSLVMGAFRNNLYDTVDYLLSVGETLTPLEKDEVAFELRRLETLKKII